MVSDETYELCLSVLQDSAIDEEEQTDKLEELLRARTTLSGQSLENAVLDALWRYREGGQGVTSPPPIRQTILRPSSASWRGSPTPASGSPHLGVSPLAPPGFVPSTLGRTKSLTASPFGSPRPSPRLAFATLIPPAPHSPNLNAYQFCHDHSSAQEIFGDLQSENVDWLVSDRDDSASVSSSLGASGGVSSGLDGSAPEFVSQQTEMSAYDMLRSILGRSRTEEEIDAALATHGYDLSATVASIMDASLPDGLVLAASAEQKQGSRELVVGRSMTPDARPTTPANPQGSGAICKFHLQGGQCFRADCRFSHDLSNYICKYWVAGHCLAGDMCQFSHNPVYSLSNLRIDGTSTPPAQRASVNLQDISTFPALGPGTPEPAAGFPAPNGLPTLGTTPPQGLKHLHAYDPDRPRSRPGSRHQRKGFAPAAPALDDADAFPSLGSTSTKQTKKLHGKRGGHGNSHKEMITPSTLADVVRLSPSPGPGALRPDRKIGRSGSSPGARNGENSPASQAIPRPQYIPWLATGPAANKAYVKARQEAIKHGGLRNKFLQSAAQAWNRNDARAAKALSLRGQSENDLMRKAHREAARELYEERNKHSLLCPEIYVDLHGLLPVEAVEYLERVLLDNSNEPKPVYAITGTGHHSKNGKDKVGRALRGFLNEWRYAYREFSVPGDRNNMGGILGIDARSWDKSLLRDRSGGSSSSLFKRVADAKEEVDILEQGVEIGEGKVKLLVRDLSAAYPALGKEPPKGPSGRR